MKNWKKNLLLAIGITVAMGAVIFNSHSKYAAFVEQFDYSKAQATGLPMFVEFGRQACPPCKRMVPVLKSLSKTHSEDFAIGYVDVIKDRQAGLEHKIEATTPTLIFYDKDAKELARVVGFMSEEDILKKWKQLEVNFYSTE
jgi:thiol-disulfide isomerase/thioredoxin